MMYCNEMESNDQKQRSTRWGVVLATEEYKKADGDT